MIKYLKREEIDVEKYNACINNALGSRVYGFSWYLDAVADQWDALVLGDYKAVMPLPKRKKYGLPYVYRLPWVQQLGIFSREIIGKELLDLFLKAVPRRFKLVDLMLNASNPIPDNHSTPLTNYLLDLHEPYHVLIKEFSKGRKSSVKKGMQLLSIRRTKDISEIVKLYKNNIDLKLALDNTVYSKLILLMKAAEQRGVCEPYEVLNEQHTVIGGAIFLKTSHRIVYLLSAINQEGRDKQAMSLLLNHLIYNNAGTAMCLDFEGSMIPEIANFMRSFGAQPETYGHYKIKRLF